jgi:hypothetical protein
MMHATCTIQVVTYVTVALPIHVNDLALHGLRNSNFFYSEMTTVNWPDTFLLC